jgi:hypothetical protein
LFYIYQLTQVLGDGKVHDINRDFNFREVNHSNAKYLQAIREEVPHHDGTGRRAWGFMLAVYEAGQVRRVPGAKRVLRYRKLGCHTFFD